MAGIDIVRFTSKDGVELDGWWWSIKSFNEKLADVDAATWAQRAETTVIFCHGATDTANSPMAAFLQTSGYRVFTFDYRGHGRSVRRPLTNSGMTLDAIAAWELVKATPDIDPTRVVVVGHSMGAGYAMAIASHARERGQPVRCIVSASGFSTWKMAAHGRVPLIGFVLGTADGVEPVDWAGRLGDTPLLITHAADDPDVPVANADRLHTAAERAGTPVKLFIHDTGQHWQGYFLDSTMPQAILEFLDGHSLGPAHSQTTTAPRAGRR